MKHKLRRQKRRCRSFTPPEVIQRQLDRERQKAQRRKAKA